MALMRRAHPNTHDKCPMERAPVPKVVRMEGRLQGCRALAWGRILTTAPLHPCPGLLHRFHLKCQRQCRLLCISISIWECPGQQHTILNIHTTRTSTCTQDGTGHLPNRCKCNLGYPLISRPINTCLPILGCLYHPEILLPPFRDPVPPLFHMRCPHPIQRTLLHPCLIHLPLSADLPHHRQHPPLLRPVLMPAQVPSCLAQE
jgi:hypothetical protein